MQIYSSPVPFSRPDYRAYDSAKEQAREASHQAEIKDWLKTNGYAGPYTGEVVRFQVADGYAQYMVGDGGRTWALIHLPYGDAYQYTHARHLPKQEIKDMIAREKRFSALFASKTA
jgi:hypothetical protein